MKFLKGGDLFYHLSKLKRLDENHARFYAGQLLLGLEYLHNMKVIYRDLKPENVLLDEDGYLKIADYGLAKIVKDTDGLSNSFAGSASYVGKLI